MTEMCFIDLHGLPYSMRTHGSSSQLCWCFHGRASNRLVRLPSVYPSSLIIPKKARFAISRVSINKTWLSCNSCLGMQWPTAATQIRWCLAGMWHLSQARTIVNVVDESAISFVAFLSFLTPLIVLSGICGYVGATFDSFRQTQTSCRRLGSHIFPVLLDR